MITKTLSILALLASIALVAPACSTVGDNCSGNSDCAGGEYCCTEGKCNNGMCTLSCGSDRDCPSDMLCRDSKFCLFTCDTDRDCAPGFACKEKGGQLMCSGD